MDVPVLFIGIGTLLGAGLVLSVDLALWMILVLALLVSGVVMYFYPQYATLRWGVVAVSGLLLLRVAFDVVVGRSRGYGRVPAPIVLLFAFAFSVLITTGLHPYPTEFIVASKNMFQFWSVPLALYFLVRNVGLAASLMKGMLCIAAVQPLIALVQYHFSGSAMFSGDRISGSFGGVIGMPGGSGELGLFMAAMVGALLALSQQGRLAWRFSVPAMAWFMVPILLANVRATLVIIPAVFLVLYLPELRRKPMAFVGVALVLGTLVAGVFGYYYKTAADYNSTGQSPTTVSQFIEDTLSYNVATDRGLSRLSSITYWLEQNAPGKNLGAFLLGHGLGSVKRAGLIHGHVLDNPKYQDLDLGLAAVPRLLWDVGVIGTFLYIMAIFATYRAAGRLRRSAVLASSERALMAAAQGFAAVVLVSLPYDLAVINNQAFSAFAMFTVGYVVLGIRVVRERSQQAVRERPPSLEPPAPSPIEAGVLSPAAILRPARAARLLRSKDRRSVGGEL